MQSIFKPKMYWIGVVALASVAFVCGGLNNWSLFGDFSTRSSVLAMAVTSLLLSLFSVTVIASHRVREFALERGVDFRQVRVRFLVAAGIFLIVGAIECVIAFRRFT
jgi:hypothetical protein